ncbi:hypothetical protein ACP4OV_018644 [Aristida adscensionis]
MASICWALLLFLAQLYTLLPTSSAHHADGGNLTHHPIPFLGHPYQAKVLLQLKKSFFFGGSTTTLPSWRHGTDCCLWEGVGCDISSGHVTVLDLNGRGLSSHGLDPAVFNLTSLQRLDLSMNDFGGYPYEIPSTGFERLALLTHLNLSNSGFFGEVPIGISKLVNLLSLNLSSSNEQYDSIVDSNSLGNYLRISNFHTVIANLNYLRQLYLDGVDLSSCGEEWCISLATSLPRLQVLSLANCLLRGPIHKSLSRLHSLVVINLNNNYELTAGPFPELFMDFPNLSVLQLSHINLEGWFPAKAFKSVNLRVLDLSDNPNLSGHLPNFSNASSLETLGLVATNFSLAKQTSSSNFKSLKELSLDGKLSMQMQLLNGITFLTEQLHDLEKLDHGQVQPSQVNTSGIGNLVNLETLEMYDCTTYGSMSSSIGNLTNLRYMYIDSCGFSGPLPAAIGNLSNLRTLQLNYLQFSGTIPQAIGQLNKLTWLDLGHCGFSGRIPGSIGNLTQLTDLYLEDNYLNGEIPSSILALPELRNMVLWGNQLSGIIPEFSRSPSQLKFVDLSYNELSGLVDLTSFWGLRNLNVLDLSSNRFRGRIPMPKSSARILEYSNNSFTSLLPNFTSYLSETEYLSFSRNNINGHIHPSICNSTPNVLDLSHNSFSGSIPSCLLENVHSQLQVLNLRENHFEGMLPSNIRTECLLEMIDLHGNKIEGQLPKGLSNCPNLEILDFGSNQIVDTFPYWLSGLSKLSVIVLRSNRFYGTIGDIVGAAKSEDYFPSLQIIDLASNNFSGKLRPEWFKWLKSMIAKFSGTENTLGPGNVTREIQLYEYSTEITYKGSDMIFEKILTTLTAIDFSNNRLEGTIPESIGRLVSLHVLNLSHNAFTGRIPAQLGGMTALESLDLSCNQLSGEIPPELTDLTFLDSLNLSNNHLEGEIPRARQFSTFDSSSFEGNAGLCGPQLPESPCGDDTPHTPSVEDVGKSSHHVDVVLFLFVGVGFGIGFAASILVNWGRMSRWFVAITRSASFANLTIGGR